MHRADDARRNVFTCEKYVDILVWPHRPLRPRSKWRLTLLNLVNIMGFFLSILSAMKLKCAQGWFTAVKGYSVTCYRSKLWKTAVGRGRVSLSADVDTCHSAPLNSMGAHQGLDGGPQVWVVDGGAVGRVPSFDAYIAGAHKRAIKSSRRKRIYS